MIISILIGDGTVQVMGFDRMFTLVKNCFIKPHKEWLIKYTTVNHRSLYGEKGFLLRNGTFERFEPIGITWNDSYCRRISDAGPSGCFVELDLSASDDFDNQENNCTEKIRRIYSD